jgi:hypothetical protein
MSIAEGQACFKGTILKIYEHHSFHIKLKSSVKQILEPVLKLHPILTKGLDRVCPER